MAREKYSYYKGRISSGENILEVIKDMRGDYGLVTDFSFNVDYETDCNDIPFNIEREYLTMLIDSKKYNEAGQYMENMKRTYKDHFALNFIEMYEYHLNAVLLSEKNIKDAIEQAKKDFNHHTITIITIIVGVITLLGTANQSFVVNNFQEGASVFFSIVLAVIVLIGATFYMSRFFKDR